MELLQGPGPGQWAQRLHGLNTSAQNGTRSLQQPGVHPSTMSAAKWLQPRDPPELLFY